MEKKLLLSKLLLTTNAMRTVQRSDKLSENHHHHKGNKRMSPVSKSVLCLLHNEGKLNQRNIAKSLNVTGQAISESLKKLEEKELITKKSGEINNENIISLTESGTSRAIKIEENLTQIADEKFASFSTKELETFSKLLDKIIL